MSRVPATSEVLGLELAGLQARPLIADLAQHPALRFVVAIPKNPLVVGIYFAETGCIVDDIGKRRHRHPRLRAVELPVDIERQLGPGAHWLIDSDSPRPPPVGFSPWTSRRNRGTLTRQVRRPTRKAPGRLPVAASR